MPDRSAFSDAARTLSDTTSLDADLCRPFVDVFHVSGASVSTLGDPLGSETICASDPAAARLDEIQLDLGEGPCWEALAERRPILEPDLRSSTHRTWPVVRQAFSEAGLGAVFAFPLVVAGIPVGAIDLYSEAAAELSDQQVVDASALSRILARRILRRALSAIDSERPSSDYPRREVHQATGMVLAQLGIGADDALLVLRGHAFASGRPLREVAADVVARTLDFTPPGS